MKNLVLLVLLLASCHPNKKFSTEAWKEAPADPAFPNEKRKAMVNDLVSNGTLNGLDSAQVVELLGPPDYKEPRGLRYQVTLDYGHDIDPVRATELDITFDHGRVANVSISK